MGKKIANNELTILWQGEFTQQDVEQLKQKSDQVIDIFEAQVSELLKIKNPGSNLDGQKMENVAKNEEKDLLSGSWIYYPWNKTLLHCVSQDDLYLLRTNRNRNIITNEEQTRLRESVVGVAGMSVGAGIAMSVVHSGIGMTIKVADFDDLDTSNLNRLRESLLNVGQSKTSLASRHILELDPFIDVQEFGSGLTENNIKDFFESPNIDIVVDEIDDFKMKIELRMQAKKYRIPLIMFTSLGDNILVDVERYDTDLDLKPFHGKIGDIANEILEKDKITESDIKKYSIQIVGANFVPSRAISSVEQIGKTLVGRPQLYSTIAVDGGLASYLIRQIILSNKPVSGRYFIKFDRLFDFDSGDLSVDQ